MEGRLDSVLCCWDNENRKVVWFASPPDERLEICESDLSRFSSSAFAVRIELA